MITFYPRPCTRSDVDADPMIIKTMEDGTDTREHRVFTMTMSCGLS